MALRFSRRRFLALTGTGFVSSLLAACSTNQPTPTVRPTPTTAGQAATPTGMRETGTPATVVTKPHKTLRVGFAISKTGPYAAAASIIVYPNYLLWAKDVNDAGGLELIDGIYTIEFVEYDDQSNPEEAIKAIQRLVNEDKVDLLLAPYGTAINLATAPLFHQFGFPQLAVTDVSDKSPDLAKQWPGYFTFGTSSWAAENLTSLLDGLASQGSIDRRVALIAVDDAFGLELSAALRRTLAKSNFELVYDESYPAGTTDFQPIITTIQQRQPAIFLACSYPNDAFALAQVAILLDFNPPVYISALGPALPVFRDQFATNIEGIIGIGGVDPRQPGLVDYYRRHQEQTGREPDRSASPICYASLQVLQQALQRVGRIDRQALIREIASGSFDTIIGTVRFQENIFFHRWQVGQWQRYRDAFEFLVVWPPEVAAASPLVPKPHWSR
ncbi:amino acid ABC transporter substrate-binding protein [Thermomicrobium sp. 4228-Ro]|uniref:amino acid ABC transporter substrate-binding protein n=1 Tax=Thermomicrobium sp. 4228-Ro TaxID=2993937 RepID=UPI00224938FA|nr:amino acid ABC transporter substrate-binding protein [Thermomicrobium sp. 4228-Ro]MCX2728302.1 amino acid ABC transporter substrate-binding protein [Thermomicrobium sp. 4228-Ro]